MPLPACGRKEGCEMAKRVYVLNQVNLWRTLKVSGIDMAQPSGTRAKGFAFVYTSLSDLKKDHGSKADFTTFEKQESQKGGSP